MPPAIKRKPQAATVRRAGWVGCNFALNRIAPEARIPIITTRSSGRESAPIASGESRESQSRLTSAATIIVPPEEIRVKYKRVKPLKDISATQRGWTLDVLNIVRRLVEEKRQRAGALQDASRGTGDTGKRASFLDCGGPPPLSDGSEFTTAEVYAFERELEKLHPDNRHVKDKIRQQLQVLRDLGLLLHVGRDVWRLP